MSKAIIIEAAGETAGILVGASGDFRFFSSHPGFDALDGRQFRSPQQAGREVAAHRAARDRRKAA